MPESNESNDAPNSSDPFNAYHRQIDGKLGCTQMI